MAIARALQKWFSPKKFHPSPADNRALPAVAALCSLGFLIPLCLVGCNALYADASGFRVIDMPTKDNGYFQMRQSQVIETEQEFEAFVQHVEILKGWANQPGFLKALRDANLDFTRESLVLILLDEPNGSNIVKLATPQRYGDKLVCVVQRRLPLSIHNDGASHCFGVAVEKGKIKQVEVWAETHTDVWADQPAKPVVKDLREVLVLNAK